MHIEGGSFSYIGSTREVNQDRIMIGIRTKKNHSFAIAAVCDGVGGSERGEVASSIVVNGIREWYSSLLSWVEPEKMDGGAVFSHLKDVAELWNEDVCGYCRERGIRTATTMSVLLISDQRFYILHVGDSRVYRILDRMELITEDEVAERVIDGRTKQFLDNYVGKSNELKFRQYEGEVRTGDMFVVCSDGFYRRFSSRDGKELYGECREGSSYNDIAEKWAYEVERRGERDNISLVLLKVG